MGEVNNASPTNNSIWNNPIKKRIIFSVSGLILWLIVVLPFIVLRSINKVQEVSGGVFGAKEEADLNQKDFNKFDGVRIDFGFYGVKPELRYINMFGAIRVHGKYSDNFGIPKDNITCEFTYTSSTITQGKTISPLILKLPILNGNAGQYPFEHFETTYTVYCINSKKEKVPSIITFDPSLQFYQPNILIGPLNGISPEIKKEFLFRNEEAIGVIISLDQPATTILFCIFINLIMWSLAISLGIFTYDITFQRRETSPPVLAFGTTILFALPSLRSTQPGVPTMGCVSDILGFFWCISIIATCSMINIFAFGLRWRKPNAKTL